MESEQKLKKRNRNDQRSQGRNFKRKEFSKREITNRLENEDKEILKVDVVKPQCNQTIRIFYKTNTKKILKWGDVRDRSTHSSVLAWRIPGTGEPGGLPSMESHRVGHD